MIGFRSLSYCNDTEINRGARFTPIRMFGLISSKKYNLVDWLYIYFFTNRYTIFWTLLLADTL